MDAFGFRLIGSGRPTDLIRRKKRHRAGRIISQYFIGATDDFHHGIVGYAELAAAGCGLGKSDSEIA
jgi:hypothetical protein